MYTTLLLTLAATALAKPTPFAEVIQVREIARRQDLSSFDLGTLIPSACLPPSSIMALTSDLPTLPADVESAFQTWSPTNACETPKFTGSVGSAYSSYNSAASSWAKENAGKFNDWYNEYKTGCPYAASLSLPALPTDPNALLTAAGCTGANAPTALGGGNNGGNGGNGGSTGAAPRQTALAAAAGMLAGVAGMLVL
ncbi:hypothetical protein EJ04DRAFT_514678 [Polyplosphaeria fusca]|uniref:Infection structure specific protein n=1 Tax=Polyplosphaeria fusca TaxID=682080 RepID=A0A9P4QPK6_9PLEO|nr:hypothetical protein EJ04DRAFT_514678 [Polyplosphaeria fusca]